MKLQPNIQRVRAKPETLSVFGLILFTDRHPHVVKVLRDDDYWTQFDELSGKTFAIFSAKPKPGQYRMPTLKPGQMGFMSMIWEEPSANADLLETFQLSDTKNLPAFVVFAPMPDGTILQSTMTLSDESEAAAYQRLKDVIEFVGGIAKGIAVENAADTASVFTAFSQQIQQKKERALLVKSVKWIPFLEKAYKFLYP